jgi:signal transduction histidine kinase
VNSIRWRLVILLVFVALLSVAAVGFVAVMLTGARFEAYLGHRPSAGMRPMMREMMGSPERRLLADVRWGIWGAAAVGAGVAAIVGTVAARRITGPLAALAAGARRIGGGDLSQQVPVTGDDEIAQVAQTFNTMLTDLRDAEESRRQLQADIAHELGTPLSVLQANVEGMLDGVVDTSPRRLALLHAQTQMLTRLVRDLRDLSLLQEGQLPLDRQPIDLRAVLHEVGEIVRPTAGAKGVTLTVTGGPPIAVHADRDRIAQVLHNLLANAVRYTDAGGAVSVTARRESGRVVVEVGDTGAGIPADDLPRVFERFHRVDRSRSRATGGAGLGLAVVKQLVEAHGGTVWATSTPGSGSVFAFALPADGPEQGRGAA